MLPTHAKRSASKTLKDLTLRLAHDQRGASFVEYVVVVGLVAIVCILAFGRFGKAINTKIDQQTQTVSGINANP